FKQLDHDHVEQRHEEHGEHGGGDHPADYAGCDRVLAASTGATGQRHRHDAEGERQGRHDDWPQPEPGRMYGGVDQGHAFLLVQILGELDDKDGVLRRKANRGHQADLEVNVGGEVAEQRGEHRTEDAQRYYQHHRGRHRPALIESGQTEGHDQHGQRMEHGRLVTGLDFLIGQAGIAQTDARWQFLHDRCDGDHGVAGAVAGRRLAEDFHRGDAAVALQLGRAEGPLAGGEGRERHHLAQGVTHVPLVKVFGRDARIVLTLNIDALDPTAIDEVVDVHRAPGGAHGFVDRGDADLQRASLLIVNDDLILRLVILAVGAYRTQFRVLVGQLQELVPRLHQCFMTQPRIVLQEEVEA